MNYQIPFEAKELNPEDLAFVMDMRRKKHERIRNIPAEGEIFTCLGKDFIVYPNVYYPSDETANLVENWRIEPGDTVLDIGTGSGVIAILAATQGAAHVRATDHCPDSIRSASANVARHKLEDVIMVKQSDMFADVPKDEHYDVIVANLPFTDQVATDIVEKTTYDEGFVNLKKYYEGIDNHLKPNGRAYVTRGNFGGLSEVFELADQYNLTIRKIGELHLPDDPRIDYAFELTRK